MSETKIKTRVIHKHDIEANWEKAVNFIPKQAEAIVYDKDDNYAYPRLKIGDGETNVNDLPFISGGQSDWNQNDENGSGYVKNRPIYKQEENKLLLDKRDLGGSLSGNKDEGWVMFGDRVPTEVTNRFVVGR